MATNTQAWAYLGGVYSRVAPALIKDIIDTEFKKNPLWAYLIDRKRLKTMNEAGRSIVTFISSGQNPNVDWRDLYGEIPLEEFAPVKTAEFPWADLSGSAVFMEKDLKQASGRQMIHDYVDAVIRTTMSTIKLKGEVAFSGAYGAAGDENGANPGKPRMMGLKDAVTDGTHARPTAGYGGITPSNESGWAAKLKQSTGLDNIVDDWRSLHNSAELETGAPDIYWTDQFAYEAYERQMGPHVQYVNFDTGDTQFKKLAFAGVPIHMDNYATPVTTATLPGTWTGTVDGDSTHRVYGLKLDSWVLAQLPGWGWDSPIESKQREPINQFAMTRLIAIETQAICRDRRAQSLLWGIPEA